MRTAALIGLIAFATYWSTLRIPVSGDATSHVYLAYSFVFDGDADLAEHADAPQPYVMNHLMYGDRVYSPYVPGNAALFAPLALVAGGLGVPAESPLAAGVLAKLLASALTALAMAVVYLTLRTVARERIAIAVVFSCAFGTYAFSVASQVFMQHSATVALVAIGLFLVRRGPAALAGLPLGVAIAVRPMNGLFALALLLYLARTPREALRAALWMLPGLAFLAVYDTVLFGSPLRLPGATVELGSPLEGIAGNLLSPSRGLLVYSPQLAAGAAALLAAWRWRASDEVRLLRTGSLAAAGALVLFGTYVDWYGGWTYGNRYLADALPLFALAIAVGAEAGWARSRPLVAAFWVATAWAVAIHAVGAGLYYFYWRGEHWDAVPDIGTTPWRLWDWTDTQWQWVLRRAVTEPDAALVVELAALGAAAAAFALLARRSGAGYGRPYRRSVPPSGRS
ncbi:MAG TPA: hypothetical protein VFM93_13015 [Candidatus Limnocylindria bacterium]|nr:hypothetical protein [Candidatus Limnocylindria bacterium]